jgi:sRNA-binding regulator protein Hfq
MSNRKLIRPSLAEIKEQMVVKPSRVMVVVLQDGETVHGVIEWYDKNSIKLNRAAQPPLLVLKHYIKYMYKENEDKETD